LLVARDETRLVELERARREFISNVSHELRTPLAGIKLMVETCVASPEDTELPGIFLPQIASEIDRLVKLVEDLLELARTEGGLMRLRKQTVDLGRTAAAAIHVFAERASNADIELVLDTDRTVTVDADPDRLAQVIINLVENALRHTPPGGTITVEVADSPERADLIVRDTGVGIPFKDLPHIFERFYVVDRSRAREATGIGLGLAIVKGVMDAHGGTVSVESELGKGATFTCSFPKSESTNQAVAAAS
jgi:two-component system phosphate regulon sensor histidine kinase PhoR